MIGRFNPLAPHGDPPADVHKAFGHLDPVEIGEPFGVGEGQGVAYRCGRCTAGPRYWRLEIPKGAFAQQHWPEEGPVRSGPSTLEGVHFLKRQPPKRLDDGLVKGCRWVTERVYRRGKWTRPGEQLPDEETQDWPFGARVEAWGLRPMFAHTHRKHGGEWGDWFQDHGIPPEWRPFDPAAFRWTYHMNPWVLYSINAFDLYNGISWGSTYPVVYLFDWGTLPVEPNPDAPGFPRPPRKLRPWRCLGPNDFRFFGIGWQGADQDIQIVGAPSRLTVTPYTP